MNDVGREPILYAAFPRRAFGLLVDLGLWAFVVLPLTVASGSFLPGTVFDGVVYSVMAGFVLYEPIMLTATGGTVGHHLLNLRVSRDGDGQKPGFFSAVLRVVLKLVLGLPSFVYMAFSRRDRASHDLLTRTHVQLKEPSRARPGHFVHDVAGPPRSLGVSKIRRLVAVLGYSLGTTILWVFMPWPFRSEECRVDGICSPNDQFTTVVMGLLWVAVLGVLLIVGWRGGLPGARAVVQEGEEGGTG